MRSRKIRRKKQMAEINVVPYIDVMLVLLIIFMVTTPLLTQGVKVNLPHAAANKLPPEQSTPIVVTVNAKGEYFANIATQPRAPMSGVALQGLVKGSLARHQGRKVYVRGDRSANYGQVVQAMVLLQKAGAGTVGLMTEDSA